MNILPIKFNSLQVRIYSVVFISSRYTWNSFPLMIATLLLYWNRNLVSQKYIHGISLSRTATTCWQIVKSFCQPLFRTALVWAFIKHSRSSIFIWFSAPSAQWMSAHKTQSSILCWKILRNYIILPWIKLKSLCPRTKNGLFHWYEFFLQNQI